MELEKFKQLTKAYRDAIGSGRPGQNSERQPITRQSTSIWFDRKTLEGLLAQTDERTGGIKIFFAQYGKEDNQEKEGHDYTGQLTLVLAASNDNEDPTEEIQIENGGTLCPPDCNGEI